MTTTETSPPASPAALDPAAFALSTTLTAETLFQHFTGLIAFRHANADRAGQGQADSERTISAKGVQQANLLGRVNMLWTPGRVFVSPLLRVRQTAQLVLMSAGWSNIQPEPLDELGVTGDPRLDAMFNDLGYAPLLTAVSDKCYFKHQNGDLIKQVGLRMLEKVFEQLRHGPKNYIWIGSHAIVTPAMVWVINEIIGDQNPLYAVNKQLIEEVNLGEAEAFQLIFLQATATGNHMEVRLIRTSQT